MKLILKIYTAIFVVVLFFTGCGLVGGGGEDELGNTSPTTGWAYNDPNNGGFEVNTEYEQEAGPGLVYIEGGTFAMGRTQEGLLYKHDKSPRRVTVSSFYMDQTEVRNVDYREYLNWLKRVYAPDSAASSTNMEKVYKNALPDTLVWRSKMSYNEPYVKYYLRHPAYNNYPVVGVSWLQATQYCKWRTDRVNEKRLIEEGILEMNAENQTPENVFTTEAYLAGKLTGLQTKQRLPALDPNKDVRRVKMSDGILLPKYRLPSEAEWEYAALAYIGNTQEERIYERRKYPWDGHNVRNPERGNRGKMMANFKRGKGDMMGVAGDLNDNASIPTNVTAYWPNDFGLYCMAGNVNEWVRDVYRASSHKNVGDFNPFRGNVFTKPDKDATDPLNDKNRLKKDTIEPEDAAGRRNYQKGDYRNYKDGDLQSRIDYTSEEGRGDESTSQMYTEETSLISDQARVYKGGSWKDRAYWLNPATRRFRDQESASNDIGFRCAMTYVGSPGGM